MKKYSLLDVCITEVNYQQVVKIISRAAKAGKRLTVAPVASHPMVLATHDKILRQILDSFDLVLPDSQYVRWALNFLHRSSIKERIYGPRLFLETCRQAEREKLKIFLYGNELTSLKTALRHKYPKLEVSGIDLKYQKIDKKDFSALVGKLTKAKANILFIGLGSPLQHEIAYHLTNVNLPIVMVGAAFDFVGGRKPQAPVWMQNYGLEWLFRLFQEPRRLWKRYLWYGPVFIIQVLREKLKNH